MKTKYELAFEREEERIAKLDGHLGNFAIY